MGKLFRVKSPAGSKHKNWRDKRLKNPFGSVYRQKTIKERDNPPDDLPDDEQDQESQVCININTHFHS